MLFAFGLLLVAAAYWTGLNGPLLLDDVPNLGVVQEWLHGERSWQNVVFGNRSGLLGRPVAMLSFLADAGLSNGDLWVAKLVSLGLHLLCGVLLLALYARLLRRDALLGTQAGWLAPLLALVWLALPIQVSSVLYLVQRMAILSALFVLLGLWLFVVARERIDAGRRSGAWLLWVGIPACTALAALSKENGLLLPPLAFALELAYFTPPTGARRPRSVQAWFALGVGLPVLAALVLLVFKPAFFFGGYGLRDFTPAERLLTEPRVLWDYIAAILVPNGPMLGLFHDDFPKSTGWLSPWTTLTSILAWLALLALAWRWRTRAPGLLAGVLLFLVGQSMESSVFGLELYFEHRNYLPSIGVLLAVASALGLLLQRLPKPTPGFRRTAPLLLVLLCAVYLAATHGRARVWASADTLYAQELAHNPDSPRLLGILAGRAIDAGDADAALTFIDAAERVGSPRERMTTALWRVLADCSGGRAPPPQRYDALAERAHGQIETYAMVAWEQLATRAEAGRCPGIDLARLTRIGQAWLAQNPLPATAMQTWRTRYYLARLLAAQGELPDAARMAERAWRDSDFNNGIGVFVFQVNASLGNVAMCREVMHQLSRARGGGDYPLDRAIDTFQHALDHGQIRPPADASAPGSGAAVTDAPSPGDTTPR